MDDDYFVRLPSQPAPSADDEQRTEPDVWTRDSAALYLNSGSPGWADALRVLGKLVVGLGMLLVALLPFAGVWVLFQFLDLFW